MPSVVKLPILCFLLAVSAVAEAQVVAGRWELIDNDPDHQTKKSEIGLWLQGDRWLANPKPTNQYDAKGLPLMALRCEAGKPEFFINVNFEVSPSEVTVSYQLDSDAPIDAKWRAEGIVVEPKDGVSFVRSLLGKRQLALIVTFPGAQPTATSFAIADLDRAIEKLRPHCEW